MRVLIINSMFFNEAYRRCADELGAIEDVDLTMLTVDGWVMNGAYHRRAPIAVGSPYRTVTGTARWKGKENRGFYTSGMAKALRASRPEAIFLMEEPFSLFAVQTLALREIFAKDVPIVFFTWNNLSLDEFDYRPSVWYRNVARWTLPRMQYALTANSDGVDVLRAKNFAGPIKSIGYGVDTSLFIRSSAEEIAALKAKLSIPADATVIGYVGRLIEMKGIDLLIDAFAGLQRSFPERKFVLLLIGSGNAEALAFRQAATAGMAEAVRHVPSVVQSEVPKYMSVMDTLVLPSRRAGMWAEQFGRVLVEAMALRVPVIGSSSGAIPEVIGDCGSVFEENNSGDLLDKLRALEVLSADERQSLLDRAEQRARIRYSWRSFARSSYEALKEVHGRSLHTD